MKTFAKGCCVNEEGKCAVIKISACPDLQTQSEQWDCCQSTRPASPTQKRRLWRTMWGRCLPSLAVNSFKLCWVRQRDSLSKMLQLLASCLPCPLKENELLCSGHRIPSMTTKLSTKYCLWLQCDALQCPLDFDVQRQPWSPALVPKRAFPNNRGLIQMFWEQGGHMCFGIQLSKWSLVKPFRVDLK